MSVRLRKRAFAHTFAAGCLGRIIPNTHDDGIGRTLPTLTKNPPLPRPIQHEGYNCPMPHGPEGSPMVFERVPLSKDTRARITFSDPWCYAELSEAVEAWGFRLMQHERQFLDRATVARRWFVEEYGPVVRMLREADLLGSGSEAEGYLRVARERYELMRTHEWNDEVIRRLREHRR